MWFYSNPLHGINIDAVRIPYDVGGEKDRRKNPKGKSCGNVWEFPRIMPNYKEATGHPTQKPEKLAERMLLASSKAGDLVVIPFAGSGSEVVQCIKNGRDFIASEINEVMWRISFCHGCKKKRLAVYRHRRKEDFYVGDKASQHSSP